MYFWHIGTLLCVYAILAMTQNLVVGYAGAVSVAHGALFGVSAYCTALLMLDLHVPFGVAIVASCFVTALVSSLLALPSLRLKGDYFALATFGFSVFAFDFFNNATWLTRGANGLPGVPRPELLGLALGRAEAYFALASLLAALATLFIWRLVSSHFGRLLRATRDDDLAAATLGINPLKARFFAFGIAGLLVGTAGSLFAGHMRFIHPDNFTPASSVFILAATILGGLGSLRGSFVGAAALVVLPEGLRFVGLPDSLVGSTQQVLYGLVLVLLVMLRPRGVFGRYELVE